MLLMRLLALITRFGQFVCAAVVLGLDAYFLHLHHKYGVGPLAREIYIIVIAALSVLLALVWMIPTTHSMLHIGHDIFWGLAWIVSFALLVDYIRDQSCGSYFTWGNITHGSQCDKWQAAEAFSFIGAMLWFLSALIGLYVLRRGDHRHVRTSRAPV